jgi:hypothetical protein
MYGGRYIAAEIDYARVEWISKRDGLDLSKK